MDWTKLLKGAGKGIGMGARAIERGLFGTPTSRHFIGPKTVGQLGFANRSFNFGTIGGKSISMTGGRMLRYGAVAGMGLYGASKVRQGIRSARQHRYGSAMLGTAMGGAAFHQAYNMSLSRNAMGSLMRSNLHRVKGFAAGLGRL